MSLLKWDTSGERRYEAGVDRGVYFPKVGPGVVWNGLVAVNERTDDFEQTFTYIDGERKSNKIFLGSFAASISAVTYPLEFDQENRESFCLSYRTGLGDDLEGLERGYRLHLVYNALAKPTSAGYTSLGSSVDMVVFLWDISTTPIPIEFARATAHLIIDSTVVNPGVMEAIENIVYGEETSQPRMPTVDEVLAIFEERAVFRIFDHGDGTFTATGPDEAVHLLADPTEFQLSWPSVILLSEDTYRASSF